MNTTDIIRPKTLNDFIGQQDIAMEVKIALHSAKSRNDAFPHTIFCGAPGLGKTSLAEIIASEMNVPFFRYLEPAFATKKACKTFSRNYQQTVTTCRPGKSSLPAK